MRFMQRKIKLQAWRLEMWKSIIEIESKTFITNKDNPDDQHVHDYADGFNDGLKMARSWFAKFVEGEES